MKLECLQIHPRPDLFYKLEPLITTEAATLEVWTRFDPDTTAILYEWKSGENDSSRRGGLRLRKGKVTLLSREEDAPAEQELLHEKELGIQDGRWHHLAFVFQNGRAGIYKDGNLFADKDLELIRPFRMEQLGPTMWGVRRPGNVGLMHAPRVWGRALSERETLTSMHSLSAPGFPGLVFDPRLTDGVLTNLVTAEQASVTDTLCANHPFFRETAADDDVRYTIEGLDLTLTQDMLPEGKIIFVHADTLTLNSPLTARGPDLSPNSEGYAGSLFIFARIITVNPGASVDASGTDGASQSGQAAKGPDAATPGATGGTGSTGASGADGTGGKDVSLWVGTLNGQLQVTSNGGNGGRGQDGGPGGGGAQGVFGNDAVCVDEGPGCTHLPTAGAQGGTGGNGGDAGRGGNGGPSGFVTLLYQTTLRPGVDGVTATINPGQPPQQAANPGAAGTPGPGGPGGRTCSANCDFWGVCYCRFNDDRTDSGPEGGAGRSGAPAAAPVAGFPGVFVSKQGDLSVFSGFFPPSLAHRTLRKAERSYFNSDFASTATLISWLTQIVPTGDGTDTDEWTCLRKRLTTLVDQMRKGLNYYGMPSNHVPLADAATYLSTLEGLITAGANIEADYNYFTDKNYDQQSRIAKLQNRINGLDDAVAQLQAAITTASALEAPTNTEIAALNLQVIAQSDVLLDADLAFQDALLTQSGCDTFQNLLTAVKGIAAMSCGDFSDVGGTGLALADLVGDSALPGFVQQIPTITYTDPGSIAAIQTTWNSLQPVINPPAPAPAAPDAGKMAITMDEFDELMRPYLAMPEAVDYFLAMHTYVGLTQAYNYKILTYDALVVKIAQLNATIALKQAETARVSALLANAANQDPDLADYVAYMEGVYQDMLTLLLRYLFEANAALDYYTLNQAPFQVGTPGQPLTMADISAAYTIIDTALPTYINGSGGPKQPFDTLPVTLAPAPAGAYPAPGNDPFAAFIEGAARGSDVIHTIRFSVPLEPNPLPGRYQITGTAFSISAPGFKTTADDLFIRLTHSGRAPFLDATGKRVEFSHTAEEVFYSYEVDAQGKETPTGGGTLGGGTTGYVGLSPCTAWTLEIRESENPGLDLSAVGQVLINFSGLCSLSA